MIVRRAIAHALFLAGFPVVTPAFAALPATESIHAEPRSNAVRVAWAPVPSAVGYVLYSAETKDGAYDRINSVPIRERETVVDGLEPGHTYFFYVVATDPEVTEGTRSEVVSATVPGEAAPTPAPTAARFKAYAGDDAAPTPTRESATTRARASGDMAHVWFSSYVPLLAVGLEPYEDTDVHSLSVSGGKPNNDYTERWSYTGFAMVGAAGMEGRVSAHLIGGYSGGTGALTEKVTLPGQDQLETKPAIFSAYWFDLDLGYTSMQVDNDKMAVAAMYTIFHREADIADDPVAGERRHHKETIHGIGAAARVKYVVWKRIGVRARVSLQWVPFGYREITTENGGGTAVDLLPRASGYRVGLSVGVAFRIFDPISIEAGLVADYHMYTLTAQDRIDLPGQQNVSREWNIFRCGIAAFEYLGVRFQF